MPRIRGELGDERFDAAAASPRRARSSSSLSTAPTLRGVPDPARLRARFALRRDDRAPDADHDRRSHAMSAAYHARRPRVAEQPRHADEPLARALGRHRAPLLATADVERLRGSVQHRAHAGRHGRAAAVGAAPHRAATSHALGALTGNQACRWSAPASRRSTCRGWQVAADANTPGRCTPTRASTPRTASRPWCAASTTRSSAPTRSSTPRARREPLLVRADRRRRRGRLRRAAQRLRADEGA